MIIEFKKFGTTLISRETGREALKALESTLKDLSENDTLVVDFDGVKTFSPSWGDETLTPLFQRYGQRLILKNTKNLSVKATLELLQKIKGVSFNISIE